VPDEYTVTIRAQGRTHKHRFMGLEHALGSLESEARELAAAADERPVGGTLLRRLDPVQIVAARLELAGPDGLRAGVDVRGDGSTEAFSGRVQRRVIEQRRGETAYDALRRALS
jgi:hypothetical protein